MFFESATQLSEIIKRTNCVILALPLETELNLKNALVLTPDENKATPIISVEQIRDFIALTHNYETSDRFFIIKPADAMNEASQNAFLKTFEEPNPYCHFILLTETPASLLPTILSRAQVFYPRRKDILESNPKADPKIMDYAKKLITASPRSLPALATELIKTKAKPREQALLVTETAIDLLYKSYFKTQNPKFLARLPALIQLYENLKQNGHIKLHLVADLL